MKETVIVAGITRRSRNCWHGPYAKRADLEALGAELFEVVGSGKVRIEVNQTYPLAEAAQAHRDLEARKTTGSTILLP